MGSLVIQVRVFLKGILRDRLLHAVLGVAFFMILLVPVFSNFSMRQVQELAITLSLSIISFILLLIALLLGASSVWRDIERRYTLSTLTLPITRASYVCSKFVGILTFLTLTALVLMAASVTVILLASRSYPSEIPIHWTTIIISVAFDLLKYLLIAAVAILFSSISTSFFLPFFGTLAIYFAGNSSQEVYEYVTGPYGKDTSPGAVALIKTLYYLLPNFSGFNFKMQATYGLPLSSTGLWFTILYWGAYTALILTASVWIFTRRELP